MNDGLKSDKKKIDIKMYVLLHFSLMLYSVVGILSKFASNQNLNSYKFYIIYASIIAILFVYSLFWQIILKHIPLTVAFANKSIIVIWGIIFGKILFNEPIFMKNLIGGVIIISGVILVVKSD